MQSPAYLKTTWPCVKPTKNVFCKIPVHVVCLYWKELTEKIGLQGLLMKSCSITLFVELHTRKHKYNVMVPLHSCSEKKGVTINFTCTRLITECKQYYIRQIAREHARIASHDGWLSSSNILTVRTSMKWACTFIKWAIIHYASRRRYEEITL